MIDDVLPYNISQQEDDISQTGENGKSWMLYKIYYLYKLSWKSGLEITIFYIMLIKSSFISTEILDLTFPVVLAGGQDIGISVLNDVEVLDNNTNCKADAIPTKLDGPAGSNGMICGWHDYALNILSSCWYLNPNGTWNNGADMLEKRRYFTMTAVENEVIVIGGQSTYNTGLKSVEKYSLGKHEGWSKMKDAPRKINRHCTVLFNTTFLMVVGGYQNADVIKNNITIRAKYVSHL